MKCARVFYIFAACGIVAFCIAMYTNHAAQDAMTIGNHDTAPIDTAAGEAGTAFQETKNLSAKVDECQNMEAMCRKFTELRAEIKRLDAILSSLRQGVQTRLAAQSANYDANNDDGMTRGNPHTDPEAMAEAERQEQERLAILENNFQNELAGDMEWPSQAMTALRQAFTSDKAAGAQVDEMECRSRQCRVTLLFQSGIDRDKLMNWLRFQLAETLPTRALHQTNQADGTITMVLYLFGNDYEPPRNGD
jgi:hypothetical protein